MLDVMSDVLDALPGLVWTTTPTGEPEWCGRAARAWFSDSWLDALHPDERVACKSAWNECLAELRPYRAEHRLRDANGVFAPFACEARMVRDREDRVTRWVWTASDISEQVALREALKEANAHRQRVETALADSKVGIWLHDLKRDVLVHSRVDGETDPIKCIQRGMIASESARVVDAYQRALADPSYRYNVEFRALEPYGEHWRLARGKLLHGEDGSAEWFVGASVDVSAVRRTEQQLELEKARLELALRSSGLALFDIELMSDDLDQKKVTMFNVWEALGYDGPLPGVDSWKILLVPEDQPADRGRLLRYLRRETATYESETRQIHRDGSIRWKLIRGIALDDEHGKPHRLIGSLVDITERKMIEAELQRAREAAEAANREKDEFLAHVSHELRTPMNAILAMTELALETPQSDHQAQLLTTVQSAAGNLVGLIDELLDFAKITAGKLDLDLGEVSLRRTIDDTMRALAPRAEQKGLTLDCDIAADVPDFVLADDVRLRQVLMNLVGNALKFTAHGRVVLEVRAAESNIRFAVIDTGIGIAKEHQRAIFGAFVQGDASTTRKYGGTGLGLTISSQLVERMGGAISVESELGRGSTFRFSLPLERCSERQDKPAAPSPAPRQHAAVPLRVLVAEDNELNTAVLRELLEQRGYAAYYARDGREAWELAQTDVHDFLLLDLHMPEMDGFEVVRAIRAREASQGGHLPIIALTARSSARDRELSLAAGMDDFLSKPILVNALWSAVDRALERIPPSPARSHTRALLDHATIFRVCGGRHAVFERLRDVFCSSLPAQMAGGRAALDARDFAKLIDAAHRLHGTLSTFSSVAGAVALRVEDAARAADAARSGELVVALEAMCASLLQESSALTFEAVRERAG